KHVAFVASFAVAGLACGGGGPVKGQTDPHLIPRGGIAHGPLHGTLNVFVIDEDTRNVVSSAAVRVGPADELEPCQALPDSTGLARFTSTGGDADGGTGGAGCKLLTKPATITVSASGHAPSTWIGVDARDVTVARRAISPNTPRATVTAPIAGWDAMPDPAADHNRLAIIGASSNPALKSPAHNHDTGNAK